jgi:uroporphyrinogen decarboxylase
VVGVDWRSELSSASEILEHRFVLQGNLDPGMLLAPVAAIERRATEIIVQGRKLPGHIFNLGHGVLPETPVEPLQALVAAVKRYGDG